MRSPDQSEATSSRILDLPAELLYYQILNRVTFKDLSNWMIATRMAIPDLYWRERAAFYLIEMDDLSKKDRAKINWQYLSTKLEVNSEFQIRRHVVDSLRALKPTYMRNLDIRVFPSLTDVMYRVQDQAVQMSLGRGLPMSEEHLDSFLKEMVKRQGS
jgi:hypothetical protein